MSTPLVKFITFKVDWIPVASEECKSIGDFGIQIWRIVPPSVCELFCLTCLNSDAVVRVIYQTTYAFVTMINNVNSFLRAQNDWESHFLWLTEGGGVNVPLSERKEPKSETKYGKRCLLCSGPMICNRITMSRGIFRTPYKLTVTYFKKTELQKCPGESTGRLILRHLGYSTSRLVLKHPGQTIC